MVRGAGRHHSFRAPHLPSSLFLPLQGSRNDINRKLAAPPPEPKATQRPWHLEPTERQQPEVSRRNTERFDDRPQTSAATRPRAASPRGVRVAGAPVAGAPRPCTRG